MDSNIEGIVLKATPCAEQDRILTLFTAQGMIKVYIKLSQRSPLTRLALASLFTRADYLLKPTKTDLYRFIDGSILEQYRGLRVSLNRLTCAQKMAHILLSTQWPGKPSPALYHLFVCFLKKAHESDQSLLLPFLIKLIKHEGELDLTPLQPLEKKLVISIAEARNFEEFPSFTEEQEQKIYSKIIGASTASI